MPAKSKKQRKLMGAALAVKRGKGKAKGKAKEVAKSMSEGQLRDFAKKDDSEKKNMGRLKMAKREHVNYRRG